TALLAHPNRSRYDVSSLKWAIGGGERTPEVRIRAFSDLFKRARYIDAYGLTESCGGDTFMEPGRQIEKIGSTGRPVAHVEVELRESRQPSALRRGWRDLPAWTENHARLLEGPGQDRGGLLQRLVPHRRRWPSRRRRLPLFDRPQEGHDHLRRREHRVLRSRARDLRTARRARGRRRRHARPALGRDAGCGRRARRICRA